MQSSNSPIMRNAQPLSTHEKGARNFLVLFLAWHLAGFQIEQMHAGQATHSNN